MDPDPHLYEKSGQSAIFKEVGSESNFRILDPESWFLSMIQCLPTYSPIKGYF